MADEEQLWWHVYGCVIEEADGKKAFVSKMYAESTMPIAELPNVIRGPEEGQLVPYLKSFDHEPEPGELAALVPERPNG